MTVTAADVTVEPVDGDYVLLFSSSQPYVISAYTVELEYDLSTPIFKVNSVEPFEVFSKYDNEIGLVRISAFAMTPHVQSTRVPLARIQAEAGFSPKVSIEILDDFNRNPIPFVGSEPLVDESTIPVYESPSEDSVVPQPTIPVEKRVAWELPVSETIYLPTPSTTPVQQAEGEELATETPDASQNNLSDEVIEINNEQIMTTGTSEIPVSQTPLSFVPAIFGIVIGILIMRVRV
ncbi:hypothetical protein [Methanocalculus chunghsingensis]|nr:hypothetical protein [Methanocalculus chunghsingensis]